VGLALGVVCFSEGAVQSGGLAGFLVEVDTDNDPNEELPRKFSFYFNRDRPLPGPTFPGHKTEQRTTEKRNTSTPNQTALPSLHFIHRFHIKDWSY
jgi:hypothetical protein